MRAPVLLFTLFALATGPARPQDAEPQEDEVILGAQAAFDLSERGGETQSLPAGARLREAPDLRSPEITVLDAPTELPVLERQGAWVRVRFGARKAWVLAPGATVEPPPSCPPTADAADLAAARKLLDPASLREGKLGPFPLLTDLPPGKLVERLELIAAGLPAAYRERYGLDPGASATGATAVLFAREAAFRTFAASLPELGELEPRGLAGNGLAALALETLPEPEAEALLIHELTHLLSRCALGRGDLLPPWLDEGIAEDLAYSPVSSGGELQLGSLAGRTTISDDVGESVLQSEGSRQLLTFTGPKAELLTLIRSWRSPERPSLRELLELNVNEFSDPERRGLFYPFAAFVVRYLLAGDGGRYSTGFRTFLRDIAGGKEATPEALFRAVGLSESALEQGLYRWLSRESGRGPS